MGRTKRAARSCVSVRVTSTELDSFGNGELELLHTDSHAIGMIKDGRPSHQYVASSRYSYSSSGRIDWPAAGRAKNSARRA